MAFTIGPMPQGMSGFQRPIGPQVDPNQLAQLIQSSPEYAHFFSQAPQMSGAGPQAPQNPLLSAQQPWSGQNTHPMFGGIDQSQIPDANIFKTTMPTHPRLAGILGGAALGAASVPSIPGTIGAGISGVAGSVANMPYDRLMQAYKMLQPGLESAQLQSKLGLEQAQTQEQLGAAQEHTAQAGYYSDRNQEQLAAAQSRGQISAALHAEAAKTEEGFGQLEDDNPKYGKKGDTAYGYWQKSVNYDQSGNPSLEKHFVPTRTADEGMRLKQYFPTTGSSGSLDHQLSIVLGGMGVDPDQATPQQKAKAFERVKSMSGLALFGANQAAPPSAKENENTRRKDRDDSDTQTFRSTVRSPSEIDKLKYSDVPGIADAPDPDKALADYKAKLTADNKAASTQYSKYRALPESNEYKKNGSYAQYLQDQSGPTSGAGNKIVPPDAKSQLHNADGSLYGYRDKNGTVVKFN